MTENEMKRIEAVIAMTTARLDTKFTESFGNLRLEIANLVSDKISACQQRQENRRRWNIGTWISFFVSMVALAGMIWTHL
jgi:hypothetical protein